MHNCLSDNTATNRLIRLCGFEAIEQGFAEMGLEKTRIRRMLFNRSAATLGKQNSISPKELGLLLERLYRGEFVSLEVSDYAIKGFISIDLFIDYEKPFISDDPKEVFDWMKSTSKESEHINKNSYHPLRMVAVFACARSYIPF